MLFSASDSRILRQILTTLHQNSRRARRTSLTAPERPSHSLAEHRAIFEAIERHEPELAKSRMEDHVTNARSRRVNPEQQ